MEQVWPWLASKRFDHRVEEEMRSGDTVIQRRACVPLPQRSEAVEASHRALAAIVRGDVERFPALYSDGDDITIGNPFGPFDKGRDGREAAGSRAASNYSDGQIVGFDHVAIYATDALACVVEVERFSVKTRQRA